MTPSIRGRQTRTLDAASFSRAADESNQIIVAFASEQPVSRYWGAEVLEISENSIRLDRLRNRAAVLLNHNVDKHVAVVEAVEIGNDRVARARIRFSKDVDAQRILADVVDGIRTKVSVGYAIHEVEDTGQYLDDQKIFRAIDWEPYEISIVSVPADDSVGVGRSFHSHAGKAPASARALNMTHDRSIHLDSQGQDPRNLTRRERRLAAAGDLDTELEQRAEQERQTGIRQLGAMWSSHGGTELARSAMLDTGMTVDAFRQLLLARVGGAEAPITRTGQLDAEQHRVAYGAGAREAAYHKPLQCFTGPDGARSAHALGMLLKAQMPGAVREQRWIADNFGSRALSSSVVGSGGALIPEEVSSELIKNLDSFGIARRECRTWPMSSDSLSIPITVSRPSATFNAAGTEVTASDPSFSGATLIAKQLMTQTVIAKETMDDAVIPLGDYVGQLIVESFAEKEDRCLFIGDSTSTYGGMTGLTNALLAGSLVDAESGDDTLPEVTMLALTNMVARLPEYAHAGAKWYMSRAAYASVILYITSASTWSANTITDIEKGPNFKAPSFGGYPIVFTPTLPGDLTANYNNLTMFLLGDMKRTACFGDRQTISILTDPYSLAGKGQVRLVAHERFDIIIHGTGTATAAGPMVGMQGNT